MSSTRRGKTGTIPVTVVQPWGEDKRVMMYIKRKDTSAQADYTAYLAEHLTVKELMKYGLSQVSLRELILLKN